MCSAARLQGVRQREAGLHLRLSLLQALCCASGVRLAWPGFVVVHELVDEPCGSAARTLVPVGGRADRTADPQGQGARTCGASAQDSCERVAPGV